MAESVKWWKQSFFFFKSGDLQMFLKRARVNKTKNFSEFDGYREVAKKRCKSLRKSLALWRVKKYCVASDLPSQQACSYLGLVTTLQCVVDAGSWLTVLCVFVCILFLRREKAPVVEEVWSFSHLAWHCFLWLLHSSPMSHLGPQLSSWQKNTWKSVSNNFGFDPENQTAEAQKQELEEWVTVVVALVHTLCA